MKMMMFCVRAFYQDDKLRWLGKQEPLDFSPCRVKHETKGDAGQ